MKATRLVYDRLKAFSGNRFSGFLASIIATLPAGAPAEETGAPSLNSKVEFSIQPDRPSAIQLPPELAKYSRPDQPRNENPTGARPAAETDSFGLATKASRISDFIDVELFLGYHEFDDGPEDDYSTMKAGLDLAITNAVHFESSYYEDRDLDVSGAMVGFWGQLPLGRGDADQERGVVRNFWNAITPPSSNANRIRTKKEPEGEPKDPIAYQSIERDDQSDAEAKESRSGGLISRFWRGQPGTSGSKPEAAAKPEDSNAEEDPGLVRRLTRRLVWSKF